MSIGLSFIDSVEWQLKNNIHFEGVTFHCDTLFSGGLTNLMCCSVRFGLGSVVLILLLFRFGVVVIRSLFNRFYQICRLIVCRARLRLTSIFNGYNVQMSAFLEQWPFKLLNFDANIVFKASKWKRTLTWLVCVLRERKR